MPDNDPSSTETAAETLTVAAEWNAGHMGCGEVIILLRKKFQPLLPGEVFKLTTYDLGAHEDLPAWCRLTRRRLLHANHPDYWIEQKSG